MSLDFMRDDGVFLPMLNDTAKNHFYQQALAAASPGKTICDIGSGTGILAVMALDAGAERVFAIERNRERADYLKSVLESTGHASRTEVICADFLDCDIRADVYVSETINTQIFGEDMMKLSNHASRHGGRFVPGEIRIWAEAYADHPVFILDLSHSEAYAYNPEIEVNADYRAKIDQDFQQQYSQDQTLFMANQLNCLFTLLPRFQDLRLKKLGQGNTLIVDMQRLNDEQSIQVNIDFPKNYQQDFMVVLKWQMWSDTACLASDHCWFGNVAKPVRMQYRTQDRVEFIYDPSIHNWRLRY